MKIGIILETKEYEKAWNAFRFAVTAKKQGHCLRPPAHRTAKYSPARASFQHPAGA